MRYQTEAVGETTWLLGELPSGGAVTITLYKLSDSSTPGLDSASCTEISTTGIYKWATTNITTPETTKTEYLYVMTDGTLSYFGKIVVGGYVDKINANISTRSSHAAADVWSVGTRALTDKAGFALSSAGITAIWNKNISAFSGAGYAGTYVKTLYDDWINAGRLDAILDIIAADVVNIDGAAMRGTDGANTTTPPTVNAIADQVWDEILTGATHNIATSAGKRLREVGAYAVFDGTAQAGTATTITLAATTNGGDGIINRDLIVIVDGTGIGQTRTIADYNDTTKVCIIDRDWRITPDNTSEYQVLAFDTPLIMDHGVAQGGTATTVTLRDYASSVDSIYACNMVAIVGGTGRGQSRLVLSYNGTTKVVTICGKNWEVIPDTTSVYMLLPYGTTCTSCLDSHALTQISDKLSTVHGTNSWETATGFAKPSDVKVTCGGGGGGGAIVERPAIWKPEEKLKLIEDIKKMYKMINELSSLQSVGLQNVKNNIEGLKNSLLKLIKEEVALLISLKVIISGQPKTDNSAMLADSINQIIAKWDSIQKSILKPSDLNTLDTKLDDITKIMAKSLSNKDLEDLINEE